MASVKGNVKEAKSQPRQEYTLYTRRWLVLAVFASTAMMSNEIWISLSSVTSIVKTYYRVNPIFIDWLALIYSLFIALLLAPGSYLVSRFGLKWNMVIGGSVNALGSSIRLIGSARSGFVYVFIGSCFCALGQCFFLFLSPHIASAWFGAHERTTASSIGMLVVFSGVGLGFLTGTFFVSERKRDEGEICYGIRNLLMFEAVTSTVLFLMCVVIMKDAPPTPPSRSQEIRYNTLLSNDDSTSTRTNVEQDHVEFSTSNNESVPQNDKDRTGYNTFERETSNEKLGHTVSSFKDSLIFLLKDKQSHILCQAYAVYSGSSYSYTTVLNQITVSAFPGKEKEIGYMGFASLISGLFSMFLSGVFLNRTKQFKVFTVADFALAIISTLGLTVALHFGASVEMVFALYILYGFFTYPYMSAGLEYICSVNKVLGQRD